jgi:hypothetical protein
VRLELELDSERAAPGGTVTGRVHVLEGGDSRRIGVVLALYEKSRDFQVAAGSTESVLHEGPASTGDHYEFSFTLADDAVPSTKTDNGELYWELEATSDERGLDTRARRRFTVAPER